MAYTKTGPFVDGSAATGISAAFLNALEAALSASWVTSSTGITAGSNFTLNSSRYKVLGNTVSISVAATYSGSAVTLGAGGAFPSPKIVAVLPSGLIPAQSNGLIQSVGSTSTVACSGYASSGNSALMIASGPAGYSFTSGDTVDLMGTYYL